jgi:hypothetical protein
MQSDAAGIATESPTMKWDAVTRQWMRNARTPALTDIAPNRSPVDGVAVPDN